MGNCGASRHAAESWADDGEWEEVDDEAPSEGAGGRQRKRPEEHVSEEVTIRITRRQLQELMERRKKKQLAHGGLVVGRSWRSTQQLLADIMESGEVHHRAAEAHWHWKPALQSIPEAAVES